MHNRASNRSTPLDTVLCRVLGTLSCRMRDLPGFPDEASYPILNSIQSHGRLQSRARSCTPVPQLYLLALTNTRHKWRACPLLICPVMDRDSTRYEQIFLGYAAFQLLVCFKLPFLSICYMLKIKSIAKCLPGINSIILSFPATPQIGFILPTHR